MVAIGKFKDLTGQRFGKLTVIKRVENNDRNKVRWLCQCDCGNTHITISYNLTHGLCQSCGCLQQEIIETNRQRRYNTYDLSGTYGIGYTSKGEEFYFDLEDYDKIKDYCWNKHKEYITTRNVSGYILFHRLVMGISDENIAVDHINHNKSDNRKNNLRFVTDSQNSMNRGVSSNNTSGITGVNKRNGKWTARIGVNTKRIFLGDYDNFFEAVKARKEAEEKYYKEYSYDNSINQHNEKENINYE